MAMKFRNRRTQFQKTVDPSLQKEFEELDGMISASGGVAPQPILNRWSELKKLLSSPNKVNATKIIYNGKEYDSKREGLLAKSLDAAGIQYVSQVEVELVAGFTLAHETIRPIKIVVDFLVCGDWFVDVKGIELQPFPIKWKMLKNKFRDSKKYITLNKDSDIPNFIMLAKREGWKDTLS